MDIFESLESEVRSYCRSWDTVFERAAGSSLYSEDGREYLDFFSGAGALNYGHNNPVLLRPLVDYLLSGAIVHSLDMKTPAKRRFLETFQELILKPQEFGLQSHVPRSDGNKLRGGGPEARPEGHRQAACPELHQCLSRDDPGITVSYGQFNETARSRRSADQHLQHAL